MNAKQIIAMSILLITLNFSLALADGIDFQKGTWKEVVAKANAEKKYIFVDAYADWCGPCKAMDKNVFPKDEVGSYYNKHFINYKFDMEKGEGPAFASANGVNAYPTFLFFNSSGELVHKAVGGRDVSGFVALGENALDENKQTFTLKKKYEKGERSSEFMLAYIASLMEANEAYEEVATSYLKNLPESALSQPKNWEFIKNFVRSSESPYYQYVLENKAKFEEISSKQEVQEFLQVGLYDMLNQVIQSQDPAKLTASQQKVKEILGDDAGKVNAMVEMYFYSQTIKAMEYIDNYLSNYSDNWEELNSYAWEIFENEDKEDALKMALKWAQKSVKLNRNWYNLDTLAHLHYKLGQKKDALAAAKEALELGANAGEDTSGTEELIKILKQG